MNPAQKKTSTAMDKLLLLKSKISFFSGLTNQNIVELIDNVRIVQFKPNELIFEEGDASNKDIYYLLSGSLDILKKDLQNYKERKITIIEEPTLFGEMRAITGKDRTTTIKTSNDGALVLIFTLKVTQDSGKALFYKNIIDELSKKIVHMNEMS
ncbi:MAG: cyclic nucleotide-binding domain-containing protein [Arcobacter sp.]|uniref:cyclic nucleotide-binding domain-containing protein n=1 Tax=Arcobacter sp. TaxID=1872629 RepID=UPI003AFFEF77